MGKTIKARLTMSIIFIVVAIIILTTIGIIAIAGGRIVEKQENELQLYADRYAEEINTWIESEMMMADGAADSIEAAKDMDSGFLQSVVDTHAEGRDELLNLYCGTSDSKFYQSNAEAEIPEGYDPTERGWYQQAAEAGETVVIDPYWDVLTNQMCATIASPVLLDGKVAAVVGADVKLTTVTELTSSIDYEKGVYGFLVDSSGNYIAHENDEYEPTEEAATAVKDIMPQLEKLVSEPGSSLVQGKDYNGVNSYFSMALVKNCDWKVGVVLPKANVMSVLWNMIVVAAIIAVAAIVLVIFIMAGVIGRMLAPIQTLKQFASGDFSENPVLEKTIPSEFKNETQQIQIATMNVRKQIRGIILHTKEEADRISSISENAFNRMFQLNEDITHITGIVNDMSQDTGKASELAKGIHATGEEMGQAIDSIAEKADNAAQQSADIMERAKKLYSDSVESSNQANRLYDETKEELETAIVASKRVDEINSLTEEILSISAQTNLLALNASIEAARAGEAGKGFAVVAEEIRILADNSREAVDKIQEVTASIVRSVGHLSSSSEKLLVFMNDKVVEDYKNMTAIARQYEEDAVFYNEVSNDLGASSQEMSVSMMGINESLTMINQLTSDIAASMERIGKDAEESNGYSDQVLGEVKELSHLSDELKKTVEAFHI